MTQAATNQTTTLCFKGKNPETGKKEKQLFYTAGPETIHLTEVDGGLVQERIRSEETAVLIARLLLQRYTPYALIPAKTWFASVLDAVELFFRVRTSFLFFLGLSTFTAAYWLIVGVSEWYEWGTFIAALILGSLITRVTRMSFLGLSLETEQWTNAMLYQQQTQQAQAQGWNEGWQVGYAAGVQAREATAGPTAPATPITSPN